MIPPSAFTLDEESDFDSDEDVSPIVIQQSKSPVRDRVISAQSTRWTKNSQVVTPKTPRISQVESATKRPARWTTPSAPKPFAKMKHTLSGKKKAIDQPFTGSTLNDVLRQIKPRVLEQECHEEVVETPHLSTQKQTPSRKPRHQLLSPKQTMLKMQGVLGVAMAASIRRSTRDRALFDTASSVGGSLNDPRKRSSASFTILHEGESTTEGKKLVRARLDDINDGDSSQGFAFEVSTIPLRSEVELVFTRQLTDSARNIRLYAPIYALEEKRLARPVIIASDLCESIPLID